MRSLSIGLSIIVPMLAYFALIRFYGINAPYMDDINDILEFMVMFHDVDQPWDQFALLFKQHNQHRTFVAHLVYLLQFGLLGSLHFVWLMMLANLSAIGLWLCYLYLFRYSKQRLYIAIATSLLIFQPHPYQAMFSAMGALTTYPVLLFAMLSLVFLQRNSLNSSLLAGLFALLCIFTNGNGIFLPIALVLTIILIFLTPAGGVSNLRISESTKPVIVYLLICTLGLFGFFYHYNTGGSSPFDRLWFQLGHIDWLIKNMFYLIGSGYSYENYTFGLVWGSLGTVFIAGLVHQKYHLQQPALMAFLLFLLLSLGAVAVIRGEPDQPVWIISSHYFHISMHIWVVLLVAYVDLYGGMLARRLSWLPLTTLALLAVFWTTSFVHHTPRIIADCLERKAWIYVLNRDLLNGTIMRDYWDGLVLKSLQRGYMEANPGEKEHALPFLSDRQSCYIGGWSEQETTSHKHEHEHIH